MQTTQAQPAQDASDQNVHICACEESTHTSDTPRLRNHGKNCLHKPSQPTERAVQPSRGGAWENLVLLRPGLVATCKWCEVVRPQAEASETGGLERAKKY